VTSTLSPHASLLPTILLIIIIIIIIIIDTAIVLVLPIITTLRCRLRALGCYGDVHRRSHTHTKAHIENFTKLLTSCCHHAPMLVCLFVCFTARYESLPKVILFARNVNIWNDQVDKHRLLSNAKGLPQLTAARPFAPFPSPLITLDRHAIDDLSAW
jgi:type IV secretory pathway VirB6-like protein